MNVFNRIAISLILLGIVVSALVFSLMPGTVMDLLSSALIGLQGIQESALRLLWAVVGLLVAVVAFMLLIAEWRPRKRHSVVVTHGAAGTAELTNESVSLRVKRAAEGVSSIKDVSPTIHSRGKAIDVLLRLSADPDVDLPRKTEEVMQAVRAEVETKMGIPIKSFKVTVKHTGNGRRVVPTDPGVPPSEPFRG